MAQLRLYDNPAVRHQSAVRIVMRKLHAMDAVLTMHASNHTNTSIRDAKGVIQQCLDHAHRCQTTASLLGVEGTAMRSYWSAFRAMNRSDLAFHGRSRRPPRDCINAMLSFGYTLLASEVTGHLHALGLDPLVGFYHTMRSNRASLALDLMEPLRHLLIDRLVLRAVNRHEVRETHFAPADATAGVRFTSEGLPKFLALYEAALADDQPKWSEHATGLDPRGDRSGRDLIQSTAQHLHRRLHAAAEQQAAA
jgi:CRISPR-associated protein Cas1